MPTRRVQKDPPVMFPCGGRGQNACPPTNAITKRTANAVRAYGWQCYLQGHADHEKGIRPAVKKEQPK